MPRIDLNVPFAEKDEAKRMGARWDGERKVWYVPDGIDAGNFERWLPDVSNFNVRASRYFIAQSETGCWKCGELTRVYAIYLPRGHETFEPGDEEVEDSWYQHEDPTVLNYIDELLPSVAGRLKAMTRHYYVDFSKTTCSSYWMNHCEACGVKQGDFNLFCEPGGAFCPTDERAASRILLHAVSEPFSASAGTSYGDHLWECMRRA